MKTQIYLALILLFILPSLSFAENKTFDGGVFFSTWGTGIQGNYYYTNEILFGGDIISASEEVKTSGAYATVEGTITLTTYEAYARYYFRELELTDGFFGQGGLAIRNWTANAEGIENDTGSKLGSVKWEWNPYVLVTGLGWHKIWGNGVSFSISMNGVWGGKMEIEYENNLAEIDSSSKTEIEENNLSSTAIFYLGYSF